MSYDIVRCPVYDGYNSFKLEVVKIKNKIEPITFETNNEQEMSNTLDNKVNTVLKKTNKVKKVLKKTNKCSVSKIIQTGKYIIGKYPYNDYKDTEILYEDNYDNYDDTLYDDNLTENQENYDSDTSNDEYENYEMFF